MENTELVLNNEVTEAVADGATELVTNAKSKLGVTAAVVGAVALIGVAGAYIYKKYKAKKEQLEAVYGDTESNLVEVEDDDIDDEAE